MFRVVSVFSSRIAKLSGILLQNRLSSWCAIPNVDISAQDGSARDGLAPTIWRGRFGAGQFGGGDLAPGGLAQDASARDALARTVWRSLSSHHYMARSVILDSFPFLTEVRNRGLGMMA